jgi:hypothetical protein
MSWYRRGDRAVARCVHRHAHAHAHGYEDEDEDEDVHQYDDSAGCYYRPTIRDTP